VTQKKNRIEKGQKYQRIKCRADYLDLQSKLQFHVLQPIVATFLPLWWCLACSLRFPIDAVYFVILEAATLQKQEQELSYSNLRQRCCIFGGKYCTKYLVKACERQHNFPPFKFALSACDFEALNTTFAALNYLNNCRIIKPIL